MRSLSQNCLLILSIAVSGVPVWYPYRCGIEFAGDNDVAWQFGAANSMMALSASILPSNAKDQTCA
jgi:hypothetical protein